MSNSTTNIRAEIIAEASAGRTAIEIYEDDTLVWSYDYFTNGATQDWYKRGQRQAVDDAEACVDWRQFEGGDVGEDGEPVQQDDCSTSYILMTYTPGEGWTTDLTARTITGDAQAHDLLCTNRDRLPAQIVALIAE